MSVAKPKLMMLLAFVLVSVTAFCSGNTSEAVAVWTRIEDSLLWRTVRQAPLKVSVDWPQGSSSARLKAKAGQTTVASADLNDTSAKAFELDIDIPESELDEKVLDLTIEYRDASGNILAEGTRSAHVGLVRGVNGHAARCVTRAETSAAWRRCEESAVMPVYADTDSVTLDGFPLAMTDTPGWAFAGPLGLGAHELSLADDSGHVKVAEIEYVGHGFMILVR